MYIMANIHGLIKSLTGLTNEKEYAKKYVQEPINSLLRPNYVEKLSAHIEKKNLG